MGRPEKIKEPDVPLSQIISDREVSIEKTSETIDCWTVEKKFKENQLKTEIVEENISTLYNLVSFPINKKKPKHVIEIEVEMLERNIKKKNQELKIMEELQVEDKKKNAT